MEHQTRALRRLGQLAARSLTDAAGAGHGRTLLVGLSGGGDSAALLLLLADTEGRHGWRVRAAHVDHRIQESEIRAGFRAGAARAARIAGVPLDVVEADADAERAAGGGIEAAARRVRYRALAEIAGRRRAELIAVAHTLDDQAETVLLHLVRGTGIDGLAGMPPIGPVPEVETDLRLARPLLGLTRADTRRVCAQFDFEPAEDPTNLDLSQLRNRLRHELLPRLREINPRIDAGLADLAASARGDRELLESLALDALGEVRAGPSQFPALDRRSLFGYPPALQARVLRMFAASRGARLTFERTRAALAVLARGHGTVELGCGRALRVAGGRVAVAESEEAGPVSSNPV